MAKGKKKGGGMSSSGGTGGGKVKGFGGKGGGWPMTKGAANSPNMPAKWPGKMKGQKPPVS